MRRIIVFCALVALGAAGSSVLSAETLPPAKDILDSVRLQQSQQQIDLQGQLRETRR